MRLLDLSLEHFRSYKKSRFSFGNITIIIGRNTAGKTNILEAIYILSHGNSFRAEKDSDVINTSSEFAKITAKGIEDEDTTELTALFAKKLGKLHKKFLINGISKRHLEFNNHILTTLFTPEDIALIIDSPSIRRNYINSVLSQAIKAYRAALLIYEKALRQRNRLLYLTREGKRTYNKEEFEYWNNLLITNGTIITKERQVYIDFINAQHKNIFNFHIEYDKSLINQERLKKYEKEELAAAVTLVGPQRDDFVFYYATTDRNIKEFCSRGEQRLTVVQTKLLEIEYLKTITQQSPLLLLDDIFSELDNENIEKVLEHITASQTIITTTHKEFVPKRLMKNVELIELT